MTHNLLLIMKRCNVSSFIVLDELVKWYGNTTILYRSFLIEASWGYGPYMPKNSTGHISRISILYSSYCLIGKSSNTRVRMKKLCHISGFCASPWQTPGFSSLLVLLGSGLTPDLDTVPTWHTDFHSIEGTRS